MDKDVDDVGLFTSIYSESVVKLPGSPYHNQYINLYHIKYTMSIHVPSKLHVFPDMHNDVPVDVKCGEHGAKVECSVVIFFPDSALRKSLMPKCKRFSQCQTLTALSLMGIDSQELTAADVPIFGRNIQHLCLLNNKLPA